MHALVASLLLTTAVHGKIQRSPITASTWGGVRLDVFGTAPDRSIFHKYDAGYGWQPNPGFEKMSGSSSSRPSAISWAENRLDYFYVGIENAAYHKYWDGTKWSPPGNAVESLGGNFTGGLSVASWGEDRIDIAGLAQNKTYLYKARTGDEWIPNIAEWLDLGGKFKSEPAIVSAKENRIDIFGITADAGNIAHKWYNGENWIEAWEDLGGGPFKGNPVASSPSPERFDIWAVGKKDGNLYHKFWDGSSYHSWENLGGNFATAPQVVHWIANRTDILGRFSDEMDYKYKYWDGTRWNPPLDKWYPKGGHFATEPAIVSRGIDDLCFFGVGIDGQLKFQLWHNAWLPTETDWWDLGDTRNPYTFNSYEEEL